MGDMQQLSKKSKATDKSVTKDSKPKASAMEQIVSNSAAVAGAVAGTEQKREQKAPEDNETKHMTEEQKKVYEGYTPFEKEMYKAFTSMMNEESIYTYNVVHLTDYKSTLRPIIDGAQRFVRSALSSDVEDISSKVLGIHGGTLGRFKSSSLGYDIREVIKNQARIWANKQVDEQYKELSDSIKGQTDEEEKKQEFQRRVTFLKAHLYKDIKDDLLTKLIKESKGITDSVESDFATKIDKSILNESTQMFEAAFRARMSANSKKPIKDRTSLSRVEAIESIFKGREGIGKTVLAKYQEDIRKTVLTKSQSKREEIALAIGGKISDGKIDLTEVGKDHEKVVAYLYGDKSQESAELTELDDKKKSIKTSMQSNEIVAPDINKGLKIYSAWIMNTVPNEGDTVNASAKIKIPVFEGVKLTFKLAGENSREDNYVTSKVELGFGASGDIEIGKLSGELGGFIETKAKTPENMAMLISYAMYRNARESRIINRNLTNAIWGMGNRSGEGKYREAEAFGSTAETTLFGKNSDDENKITYGGYGKFAGELGDMDNALGGEFSLKGTVGKQYSKKAFEAGHSGHGRLGVMESSLGRQLTKGDTVETIGLEAAAGGLGGKGQLGMKLKFQGTKFTEAEIEGAAQYKVPVGTAQEQVINMISEVVSDLVAKCRKSITSADKVIGKKTQGSNSSTLSSDIAGKLASAQDKSEMIAKYAMVGTQGYSDSFSMRSGYKIKLGYTYSAGGENEFSIALETLSTSKVEAGVFEGELEKSRRILKWSSQKGFA